MRQLLLYLKITQTELTIIPEQPAGDDESEPSQIQNCTPGESPMLRHDAGLQSVWRAGDRDWSKDKRLINRYRATAATEYDELVGVTVQCSMRRPASTARIR